MYIIAWTKT